MGSLWISYGLALISILIIRRYFASTATAATATATANAMSSAANGWSAQEGGPDAGADGGGSSSGVANGVQGGAAKHDRGAADHVDEVTLTTPPSGLAAALEDEDKRIPRETTDAFRVACIVAAWQDENIWPYRSRSWYTAW